MAAYETAVAVKDFKASKDDELSIKEGDRVKIKAYNNSAGTAQGEKEDGTSGWFPMEAVRLEQHMNAFDFLASKDTDLVSPRGKTPRNRKGSIVTDTGSLFDRKEETKESLSKFLQAQPPKQQLLDKNIILEGYDREEFKQAQANLQKEKENKRAKLEKFFSEKVEGKAKAKKAVVNDISEKKLDELAMRVLEVPLERSKHRMKTYDNCFTGSALVHWLQENKFAKDKAEATKYAQTLLHRSVIYNVVERTSMSFSSKDLYNVSCRVVEYGVMNMDKVWGSDEPGDTLTLATELLTDLIKYVHRKKLDFPSMRGDPEFVAFSLRLAELQKCRLESLTYGSKEAFWINIFNLMVLYMHCRMGPPKSGADRQLLYDKCYFVIAKSHFTVSDVRNNIILGTDHFPAKDKRATMVVGEKDGKRRALFLMGLADGTSDAPAFYLMSPSTLEAKLSDSCRIFLHDSVRIDVDELKVFCPRLIQRLRTELRMKDDAILDFVAENIVPSQAKVLRDQPGFELAYDDSRGEPCYAFDPEVIG